MEGDYRGTPTILHIKGQFSDYREYYSACKKHSVALKGSFLRLKKNNPDDFIWVILGI